MNSHDLQRLLDGLRAQGDDESVVERVRAAFQGLVVDQEHLERVADSLQRRLEKLNVCLRVIHRGGVVSATYDDDLAELNYETHQVIRETQHFVMIEDDTGRTCRLPKTGLGLHDGYCRGNRWYYWGQRGKGHLEVERQEIERQWFRAVDQLTAEEWTPEEQRLWDSIEDCDPRESPVGPVNWMAEGF